MYSEQNYIAFVAHVFFPILRMSVSLYSINGMLLIKLTSVLILFLKMLLRLLVCLLYLFCSRQLYSDTKVSAGEMLKHFASRVIIGCDRNEMVDCV